MSAKTETKDEKLKRLVSNDKYKEAGQLYSPMGVAFYLKSTDYNIKVHAGPGGWQSDITSFEVKEAGEQLKSEVSMIDRATGDLRSGASGNGKGVWCQVIAAAGDVEGESPTLTVSNLIDEWVSSSEMALKDMSNKIVEKM